MRLAAAAKQGFYPANPRAVQEIIKHLYCRAPDPTKANDLINIIDPCAGKGMAIRDLAMGLGVPEEQVYTVELDAGRSEDIKALMPKSKHLGPCGFYGAQITGFSFGLAYVNPPFDTELGGGKREEQGFTERAIRLLASKGILVLVCPPRALVGNRGFCQLIDANLEDVAAYKFPDGVDDAGNTIRPYNEIIVIGKKRPSPIPTDAVEKYGKLHSMQMQYSGYVDMYSLPPIGALQPKYWTNGRASFDREEHIRVWEIPHSWKPHVFKKTMFTEDELAKLVVESPLNGLLKEVVIPPPNAPPLSLGRGHTGLILASGMLDGVVVGPYGPHVVRGSSHKIQYHNKEQSGSEVNPDSGAVTTKDVYSERMVTVIRVVEQDGKIMTFSNEPEEKDEDDNGGDDE